MHCRQCKNKISRVPSVKCVNLRTILQISSGIVWGIVYFKFYPRGFSFSTFDYRYFELIAIFNGKYKLLEPQKCPHNPEVVGSSPASATIHMCDLDEQGRLKNPPAKRPGDFCALCYHARRDPRLMGRLNSVEIVHYAIQRTTFALIRCCFRSLSSILYHVAPSRCTVPVVLNV